MQGISSKSIFIQFQHSIYKLLCPAHSAAGVHTLNCRLTKAYVHLATGAFPFCLSTRNVETLNNIKLIHRDYPDYTLLRNTCIIHNLLYVDDQFCGIKKQSHVHIETSITHISIVCNGEIIQLKTIGYLYILLIENM